MLAPEQLEPFFEACDTWQRPIFTVLTAYGLRVGELTHLLVSDVDLNRGVFVVRSKPYMLWHVKTSRQRDLPILPQMLPFFERAVDGRGEGFLFRNRDCVSGDARRTVFRSPEQLQQKLVAFVEAAREEGARTESDLRKAVVPFLRKMGQVPEKRIRQEFIKITKAIGCPTVTRVHSLRHVLATRAQELGVNPLLVKELLGHSTLAMTGRYTHLGMEAKRQGLNALVANFLPAGTVA